MKTARFNTQKHTGKQTAIVAAGPIGNGSKSVVAKYADTIYYQIGKHNDFVQEQGG